jgi:hypothetical protein
MFVMLAQILAAMVTINLSPEIIQSFSLCISTFTGPHLGIPELMGFIPDHYSNPFAERDLLVTAYSFSQVIPFRIRREFDCHLL